MPGPKSKPFARDEQGRIVQGKTALGHARLRSGENVEEGDTVKFDKNYGKDGNNND